MAGRDPYLVLGVEPGASATIIKGAWRRLARAHHPDLAADAAERRAATRRMAEINAAYEELRRRPVVRPVAHPGGRPAPANRHGATGAGGTRAAAGGPATDNRPAGPPPPPPTRPVTARFDTSDLFRPRNATTTPEGGGYRHRPLGQEPRPVHPETAEPPRASTPTGPARLAGHRRPRTTRPSLPAAWATAMVFGKFHGLTLGEIAAREPSYLAWVARTITRDPDLVAAARVILTELGMDPSDEPPAVSAEPATSNPAG